MSRALLSKFSFPAVPTSLDAYSSVTEGTPVEDSYSLTTNMGILPHRSRDLSNEATLLDEVPEFLGVRIKDAQRPDLHTC
jgi:hypothetical protein